MFHRTHSFATIITLPLNNGIVDRNECVFVNKFLNAVQLISLTIFSYKHVHYYSSKNNLLSNDFFLQSIKPALIQIPKAPQADIFFCSACRINTLGACLFWVMAYRCLTQYNSGLRDTGGDHAIIWGDDLISFGNTTSSSSACTHANIFESCRVGKSVAYLVKRIHQKRFLSQFATPVNI